MFGRPWAFKKYAKKLGGSKGVKKGPKLKIYGILTQNIDFWN